MSAWISFIRMPLKVTKMGAYHRPAADMALQLNEM